MNELVSENGSDLSVVIGRNFGLASRASKHRPAFLVLMIVQYRFSTILIAVCTKVMRRLSVAIRFFQSIRHGVQSVWLKEFVAFAFLAPCFKLHDLVFQIGTHFLDLREFILLALSS